MHSSSKHPLSTSTQGYLSDQYTRTIEIIMKDASTVDDFLYHYQHLGLPQQAQHIATCIDFSRLSTLMLPPHQNFELLDEMDRLVLEEFFIRAFSSGSWPLALDALNHHLCLPMDAWDFLIREKINLCLGGLQKTLTSSEINTLPPACENDQGLIQGLPIQDLFPLSPQSSQPASCFFYQALQTSLHTLPLRHFRSLSIHCLNHHHLQAFAFFVSHFLARTSQNPSHGTPSETSLLDKHHPSAPSHTPCSWTYGFQTTPMKASGTPPKIVHFGVRAIEYSFKQAWDWMMKHPSFQRSIAQPQDPRQLSQDQFHPDFLNTLESHGFVLDQWRYQGLNIAHLLAQSPHFHYNRQSQTPYPSYWNAIKTSHPQWFEDLNAQQENPYDVFLRVHGAQLSNIHRQKVEQDATQWTQKQLKKTLKTQTSSKTSSRRSPKRL